MSKLSSKRWAAAHPREKKAHAAKWYQKNKEAIKKRVRANYKASIAARRDYETRRYPKRRAAMIARAKHRRQNDPAFAIKETIRSRIRIAVKIASGKKAYSTMALIGCTVDQLRKHIQDQFKRGMAWNNYGRVWHIDHITPVCYFDLTDPKEQRRCFHFSNLRPLWAKKNLRRNKFAGAVQQVFHL